MKIVAFRRRAGGNDLVKQETSQCQTNSEIREQVTAKIIAALEKDLLPWRQMWSGNTGGPAPQCPDRKGISGREHPPAWASRCRARFPIQRMGNVQPVEADGLLCQSSA